MDPSHLFDGKRMGTHCSCGHAKGEHVTRYEPRKGTMRELCRGCAE